VYRSTSQRHETVTACCFRLDFDGGMSKFKLN
jgi:hypothetical protein